MKYHPNAMFSEKYWQSFLFYEDLARNDSVLCVFCGFLQIIHRKIGYISFVLEKSTKYGILKLENF